MEELLFHALALYDVGGASSSSSEPRRRLAATTTAAVATTVAAAKAPGAATTLVATTVVPISSLPQPSQRWKADFWSKDTTEPAMLRVPIAIILFIFLFAGNIWIFERMRMQYYSALSIKANPVMFAFLSASLLAATYAATITIFTNMLGLAVESGVLIFYVVLLVAHLLPATLPGQETKASFYRLVRTIFFPGTTISFPEVLLADALCSMSKVLKDFGVTIITIYASLTSTPLVDLHEHGMLLCAILASLPFWVRVRQCWVQLDSCHDGIAKIPIVLNIIKYLTGFPPIWLAAAASLGYFHPSLPTVLALMATINSVYSYLWDVFMDWGLLTLTREGRLLPRPRIAYPVYIYVLACILNLVIRFSWAANRIPSLAALHASHLVLMVEVLEVFRRAVWNLFRVEWELIVQAERHAKGADSRDSRDNLLNLKAEEKPGV